jgi:uncharacterized protein (DUF433 family)
MVRQDKFSKSEQTQIVREYNDGDTIAFLADKYNSCQATIFNVLIRGGASIRSMRKIEVGKYKDIINLYNDGYTTYEIAEKYKVDAGTIQRTLTRCDIKKRTRGDYKIYSINEHYFDSIDTPDKAYFFGLLYSDGCNNYVPNKSYNIILQLSGEEDKDILIKLLKYIGSNSPISKIIPKDSHWKPIYRVSICNKHMSTILNNYGVGKGKTYNLKFPTHLKPELYSHFIRGVFDGDGSISTTEHRGAYVNIIGTKDFCINLNKVLNRLKINNTVCTCHNTNPLIKEIRIVDVKSVLTFCNWIYWNKGELYLKRKYRRYVSLYKKYSLKK